MEALPGAQSDESSRLKVDALNSCLTFVAAPERYPCNSTIAKVMAPLKSLIVGSYGKNGPIKDSLYMARRDGLLNQVPFKISTARSCPEKGGYGHFTFFDCPHIARCRVGTAGRVFFPLKTHETWLIVEPFACNRLKRTITLQAGITTTRQQ